MIERMLVDVCKRCGGWLSIGGTVDEDDATENATTVTLRIPNDHDLGEYANPAIGGCRCDPATPTERRQPHPATSDQPAKVAENLRWLAYRRRLTSSTWCY